MHEICEASKGNDLLDCPVFAREFCQDLHLVREVDERHPCDCWLGLTDSRVDIQSIDVRSEHVIVESKACFVIGDDQIWTD